MTIELLEALAADLLEDQHLVCLDIIFEDGGLHHGTLYIGSAHLDSRVIRDQEDFLELHISTLGIGEPLHKDLVASLYLKLLACNVYDCVHRVKLVKSFGRKRLPFQAALYQWLSGHQLYFGLRIYAKFPTPPNYSFIFRLFAS